MTSSAGRALLPIEKSHLKGDIAPAALLATILSSAIAAFVEEPQAAWSGIIPFVGSRSSSTVCLESGRKFMSEFLRLKKCGRTALGDPIRVLRQWPVLCAQKFPGSL